MSNSHNVELAFGIEVVSVETALNFYPRNLLDEIYKFRGWQLRPLNWKKGLSYISQPNSSELSETDFWPDNPGAIYFTKSDRAESIVGMLRLSPSIDADGNPISMLGTTLSHVVNKDALPNETDVYEGSRLILDRTKLSTKKLRIPVVNELVAATVLFAKQNNIREFFGFMTNKIWESTYERLGFVLEQIGPDSEMQDGDGPSDIGSARRVKFDERNVLEKAQVDSSILNFGRVPKNKFNE